MEKIKIDSKEYPAKLREIANPPMQIYVIGNKSILNNRGIAIVGSRDCTKSGAENARMFAANLASDGFTIISGMAKGIDANAHLGALEVCGKTIAVLGCGADYIYPKENEEIYKAILKSGGAIISEYPSGTEPESDRFRKRNRIVSALSMGVLIVEAEQVSGTTITARYAKQQGKEVFCIPSDIRNRKGIGTNALIKKGAILVQTPNDISEAFGSITKTEQITIEELNKKSSNANIDDIKEEYRNIYKVLQEPLSINEISIKTKMDVTEIYSKLFLMEIEGIVQMKENKYIRK